MFDLFDLITWVAALADWLWNNFWFSLPLLAVFELARQSDFSLHDDDSRSASPASSHGMPTASQTAARRRDEQNITNAPPIAQKRSHEPDCDTHYDIPSNTPSNTSSDTPSNHHDVWYCGCNECRTP